MDNPEKLANKHQRKPKGQSRMDNPEKLANKHQRKPKGQSRMDNPEKLAALGTQDITRRKTKKQNTQHRKLK